VFPRLSPLFPEAVAAPNILYTGFTNANAMLHVANCVANAGRIESGDSYKFYAEGVTPAVARLYEARSTRSVLPSLRRSAHRFRPWLIGSIASMGARSNAHQELSAPYLQQ
jgi:NAD/NADP octopine/nopaline dehydrogenase, alpha-helical domain